VKEDARLTELIDRYNDRTDSLTDEELQEMVDRSAAISDAADGIDPDASWEDDYFTLEDAAARNRYNTGWD
jgi:hypothetical protein